MHAFDRQTDRRTDRIRIAIPRLHSMQRGKNCTHTIATDFPTSLPWNYMSVPHTLNSFSDNEGSVSDITIQSDQLAQTKTTVTSDAR